MSLSAHTVSSDDTTRRRERTRLELVSQWYDSRHGLNREIIKQAAAYIVSRAHGKRALELGSANGVMTQELAARFPHLDVVEAAPRYVQHARGLLPPRGRVYQCLFEEFQPKCRYHAIVMSWILEHVADPRDLLTRARDWLAPQGEIHLVVPNAESLHRRVGLAMGLLPRLNHLNESDIAIGHRRVYTWQTLSDHIAAAGLRLVEMQGLLLKPLPNALMESYPPDLRAAFFELSSLAPRLCSEIYAVCHHPNHAHTSHTPDRLR